MLQKKVLLTEDEMPRQWYNILPDLPNGMLPPLHPGTGQPVGPDDLAPIFPMNLIEQEVSPQRWIDIPEPVLKNTCTTDPAPWGGPIPWSNFSKPRPRFISRMRGSARRAATSPIPPFPRPITTRSSAPSGSPPKPAPDSGAAP
jgi:hypothetical protein